MTIEEFRDQLVIKNSLQAVNRNVAQYYMGDEWVMNAYEAFGSLLDGLKVWYLLPYVREDGKHLCTEKLPDVTYDETCIFGNIPKKDIPKGCHPFDCGYGGTWSLSTSDDDAALAAAFVMWTRQQALKEKEQA